MALTRHEQAVANAIRISEIIAANPAGVPAYITRVGGGHYSSVYEHSSAPGLVIKVTTNPNEASITYLGWARANPGPHVPQVYHLKRYTNCQVAVINKLYKLDTENYYLFEEKLNDYSYSYADEFAPAAVAKQIRDFFRDIAGWDLHSDNVMQDCNRVMVITDPITQTDSDESRALRTGIERAYGIAEAA